MPDNSKKDPIEKIFEKKAWDYDISYDETDWMELENRLDILDKQRANRNRRRWVAVAAVLLFSLLGYFTYQNYIQINQISQLLSINGEDTTNVQPDRSGDGLTNRSDSPSAKEEADTSAEVQAPKNQADFTQKNATQEQEFNSALTEQKENNETSNQGSQNFLLADATGEELFVAELSCSNCDLSRPIDKNQPLAISDAEIQEENNIFVQASPEENKNPGNNNVFKQVASRLSVGLVASPDLSTVGSIADFRAPGYKVGMKVEYSLAPNLAITSGIIQSEVKYLARGGEYKPPYGFWTNGIVASETMAKCMLLDIPLSLKYDFLQFSQSRFFATAGLSSYIMLNEDYHFNYESQDPGLVQGWNGKTGTRHWFSNAGFSVGYELDVHPNWSLRAEPFIKIPVNEVGWGNVNLYSIGSFISLNYKLGKD